MDDKAIQEFKDIYEKEHGKEISWDEASEMSRNLLNFAKIIYDLGEREFRYQQRLKQEPKGFHLEGQGYTCVICHNSMSDQETWYDKHGLKCLVCQKAIDKKIIPGSVVKKTDNWYSTYDLESRFNISRHVLKRFVKEGVLKPRIVLNESGKPRVQIFLIKDNKDTLPPKKMTDSQMVKETKDGKDWYHSEPWYRFVDPIEALKGYKIINYLRVVGNE
jgi:hypothetical protein